MGPITVTVEIDLARRQIFETIADLSLRPAFTGEYQSDFRLERVDPKGVGAAARFRVGKGWASTQIVEVESPHRLVEQGRTGRLNRVETKTLWELVEAPSGVTEVSVTFVTHPATLFDRLAELRPGATRRHRRGWQASLRRLREQLETGMAIEIEPVRIGGVNRLPTPPSGTLASI